MRRDGSRQLGRQVLIQTTSFHRAHCVSVPLLSEPPWQRQIDLAMSS